MDVNSDELELKNILVELEHEHQHLQLTVRQLQSAIDKREIELKRLLAKRELRLLRGEHNSDQTGRLRRSQTVDLHQFNTNGCQKQATRFSGDNDRPKYSSDFCREVNQLLDKISQTSEEVSALIRF